VSHNNVNDEFVSYEIGGGLIRAALFGALVAYRSAQRRMLEQWAESSEEKRRQLWQDLHACEAAATLAIEYVQGNGSPPHRPSQPQGDDALDARRLDWLMRNVSGKEYRRIGIYYADGCTRDLIDAAMEVDDYRASLEKSHD